MDIQTDLLYTESHEWVRAGPDGVWTVGITYHAQEALGDIVSIELPEAGRKVAAGEPIAVIESVKAASDIHSPVAGEITEVNTGLTGEPDALNRAPYESWLFRVQPDDGRSTAGLLGPDKYAKLIEE